MGRRYRLGVRPTHKPVRLFIIRNRPKATASSKDSPRPPAKPPHGVSNNGEFAHLYSGNIMYDPGFELFVGNALGTFKNDPDFGGDWADQPRDWETTTGVRPYYLPRFNPFTNIGQMWPNDEDVSYFDIAQWGTLGGSYDVVGQYGDSGWRVTRVDPYAGRWHVIYAPWGADSTYGIPPPLYVQAPGLPGGYSARVKPGDLITFTVWMNFQGHVAYFPVYPIAVLSFYNQSGDGIVSAQKRWSLGTDSDWTNRLYDLGYKSYTIQATAPPNSYFLRAQMGFRPGGEHPMVTTVDAGILSIE